MAKIWDNPITDNTDWGGDSSTNNQPVSGRRVQEWIKARLQSVVSETRIEEIVTDIIEEKGIAADGGFVTLDSAQDITGEKNFKGGLKINDIPITYDAQKNAWLFQGNLLVTRGIASYTTIDNFDKVSVFDDFPFDGNTIIEEGGIYKVNPEYLSGGGGGGEGGSVDLEQVQDYLDKEGYATQSWVQGQKYLTQTNLSDLFVTVDTEQRITGSKDFTGGLKVSGIPIVYDAEKNAWEFQGNLLVTGGGAFYTSLAGFESNGIMDAIKCDGTTIYINENKELQVIGGGGGGGISAITSEMIEEALGYTPFDSASFSQSNIKSTLGIYNWALASSKPSYSYDEITDTPTSMKNPYSITFSGYDSGEYDGSSSLSISIPHKLSLLEDDILDGNYLPIDGTAKAAEKLLSNGQRVYYDATKNVWVLEGNLLVSGGLATYTKLAGWEEYGIMDAIETDETTISKVGGVLRFIGETGGLDKTQLADYLTSNGYATQTWVTNKGYALQSSLTAVDNRLKSVETFFATDDTDLYVNKWDEIVTFLNAVEGDTLDDILSTKFDKASFTKANIKSTLGISDWALASTKPSYTWDDITSKPSYLFYSKNAIINPTDTTFRNASGYAYNTDGGGTTGVWASFYSHNYIAQIQFNYSTATPYVRAYNYQTSSWSDWNRIALHSTFDNYVPLATAKDITAIHNFVNGVKIGGKAITYDSTKNAIILPTNVVIEGGLATYTKLEGWEDYGIMDAIEVDGTSIIKENGVLKAVGGGGGGDVSITGAASTIVTNNLTASRALISNSSGKVAVSAVTSTELGYLDGVTSNIQTQLNNKQATLMSGLNIKTINNQSILGSGNITISGGSSSGITLDDVAEYLEDNEYLTRVSTYGSGVAGVRINTYDFATGLTINRNRTGTYDSAIAFATGGTNTALLVVKWDKRLQFAPYIDGSAINRFQVDSSGNVTASGAVTENSDRKLKNVEYEGDGLALTDLKKIKVAKWHWKDKRDDKMHIGGVTDNLMDVIPEAVFESEDENGVKTSSIAYGKAGYAVAASLIAPVANHEDRIAELEKSIEKMQKELNKLRA